MLENAIENYELQVSQAKHELQEFLGELVDSVGESIKSRADLQQLISSLTRALLNQQMTYKVNNNATLCFESSRVRVSL